MMNSNEFLEQANSIKVIAFMEIFPLTDKFEQIALTEVQAKQLREALFRIVSGVEEADTLTKFQVITNDKVTVTLPDVHDFYDETYLKEAQDE